MTERPTILVPIRVFEGESIPEGVPELLANAHVVLLGYHVIPEQTAPGQAQMEFEERGTERLEVLEESLTAAGATVERRLVFTHQAQKTIDRHIYEHDCAAVLVPNATGAIEDVLVPVRGTVGADVLARVVAGLFADTEATITLYHVAETAETDEEPSTVLERLQKRLVDHGIASENISTRVEQGRSPTQAITEAASEFDVVVMGESDPSLTTFVFGMAAEQVAERFLGPVVIVQRARADSEESA